MPTSISSDAIAKQRDLLIIGDGLWRRFAEGDLVAHFLHGRGEGFDLFLLLRDRRCLFHCWILVQQSWLVVPLLCGALSGTR